MSQTMGQFVSGSVSHCPSLLRPGRRPPIRSQRALHGSRLPAVVCPSGTLHGVGQSGTAFVAAKFVFFSLFSAKIKTPEGACVLCKRGLRGFFDGCCPASSLLLSVFLYSSVFYFSARSPAQSAQPALSARRRYRQADPRSRLGPWLGF